MCLLICILQEQPWLVQAGFLQGLLFKAPENLAPHFLGIKDKILRMNQILAENNLTLNDIAINFAMLNTYIDNLVIGVDSLDNLKENMTALENIEKVTANGFAYQDSVYSAG